MESSRWKVQGGKFKVESSRWKVECGKFKVESSRWKVECGKLSVKVECGIPGGWGCPGDSPGAVLWLSCALLVFWSGPPGFESERSGSESPKSSLTNRA